MPPKADPASSAVVQDFKRPRPKKLSFPLPARIPLLDPSLEIPPTPGSAPSTPRPLSSVASPHFDYLSIKRPHAFDDAVLPLAQPPTPGYVTSSSPLSTVREGSSEDYSASNVQHPLLSPSDILGSSNLGHSLPSLDINTKLPGLPRAPLLDKPLRPPPPIQLPGLSEFLSHPSSNSSRPSLQPASGDVDNMFMPMPEYSASSSFTASPQLLPINPEDVKLEDPPDFNLPPLQIPPPDLPTSTSASRRGTDPSTATELTLASALERAQKDELSALPTPDNSKTVSKQDTQSTGFETDDDEFIEEDLGLCTLEHRPPEYIQRTIKKRRVCAAFRQIMRLGIQLPSAGLVTARDPVYPKCIWTNPVAIPFSELKPDDLILITRTGEIFDGSRRNASFNHAAVAVHNAIYQERPEVDCIVSGHPMNAAAFCAVMGRRGLDMLAKDFCVFYHNHAVYTRYGGVINGSFEASNIVTALGPNKALLLRNHGILTVGTSVESAIYWFTQLEKYCQIQLLVESTGRRKRVIADDDARRARKIIGNERVGWFNGDLMLEMIEKETGLKELG